MPIARLFGAQMRDVPRRRCGLRPRVGASKPAIMRSVVVLPQPLGPRNVTNSPRSTASENSAHDCGAPKLLLDVGEVQKRHHSAPIVW